VKREVAFIVLVFFLSFPFARPLTLAVDATVETVRVPQDFSTIQQAIDASFPGGTVLVGPGTYNENITVWKPLMVTGWASDLTIIDQPRAFAVCHITANNVVISGFTIRSGSIGIWIDHSDHNLIISNVVTSNDDGIWITSSDGSVISNNVMTENLFMSLYVRTANNTTADTNTITNNTYGIYMQNSENSQIYLNTVSLNYADGISATYSNSNAVYHNLISNNSMGIYLQGSNDNSIYENNIVYNDDQALATNTQNNWDNGSRGNYWSNYNGADNNGDGIGDTAFIIDSNNTDRYPLMNPWTPPANHNVAIISVWSPKTVVGQGYSLNVTTNGANKGEYAETLNVTAQVGTNPVGTETVPLGRASATTITFSWNTGGLAFGNYTLSAYAEPVANETDTTDNKCIGGLVTVTIPGDVDGNFRVSMDDIMLEIGAFGSKLGQPKYKANADITNDGRISMDDMMIAVNRFGRHYP
jgi:parallel beta-helix repeat protein